MVTYETDPKNLTSGVIASPSDKGPIAVGRFQGRALGDLNMSRLFLGRQLFCGLVGIRLTHE